MGIRDIAVSRGQTVHCLRRSQINIKSGLNIRDLSTPDNIAHVEWLAGQIEQRGFEGNVVIFMEGDAPYIWQGHCRMAAIDLLIERGVWNEAEMLIPTLMRSAGVGMLEMIAEQSRNGASKALSPREAAANILRIMNLVGQDRARTAQLIGRSVSYVSQMLTFNEDASEDVHEAISKGMISQSQAASILRKEGSRKGAETIKQAVEKARASGKKKATKKHVQSASRPVLEPRRGETIYPGSSKAELSHEAVHVAAIVLARNFLDRVTFEWASPELCMEAQRIVDELDIALGEKALQAAE